MLRTWFAGLTTCLLGCGSDAGVNGVTPYAGNDAGLYGADRDSDGDGLCDSTEVALGTDPNRPDSDGDGLLDVHEQIAGTDPRNRLDPAADRVAHLRAGQSLDFDIALIAPDAAPAIRGELVDRNALDPESRRAGDFYRGDSAVSAEPPDNVRGIEQQQARFVSVLGKTRLQFRLQFAADDSAAATCAPVLPFFYFATTDADVTVASERMVLIVSDQAPPEDPNRFCLPVACL